MFKTPGFVKSEVILFTNYQDGVESSAMEERGIAMNGGVCEGAGCICWKCPLTLRVIVTGSCFLMCVLHTRGVDVNNGTCVWVCVTLTDIVATRPRDVRPYIASLENRDSCGRNRTRK